MENDNWRRFSSSSIELYVDETKGSISSVLNKLTGEKFSVKSVEFSIITDKKVLTQDNSILVKTQLGDDGADFWYENNDFTIILHYELKKENDFYEKWIEVKNCKRQFSLHEVRLFDLILEPSSEDIVKYETFLFTPTAVFIRTHLGGFYVGIENPFFQSKKEGNRLQMAYEPSIIISKGETYISEPQFLGVYARTGKFIKETPSGTDWPIRFHNPCGHIPLDWGEVRAMQEFVRKYMPPRFDTFPVMVDGWWYQFPFNPQTPEQIKFHYDSIDRFKKMGVDLVTLVGVYKSKLPSEEPMSTWELTEAGEKIIEHLRKKRVKYGVYFGGATPIGKYGCSADANYCPNRHEWKRIDEKGREVEANCIACDEFKEWYFKVQDNTIKKYGLSWWCWDGTLGYGEGCYSNVHGHLPGKGGYKAWRNNLEIIRRLKESNPGLWIHIYWGLKEYGPWGLKYVDTHENYWENQDICGGLVMPDFHVDRLRANDLRLQCWWNRVFRFLPVEMSYAPAHRGTTWSGPIEVGDYWDEFGWKFALLSAIATSGNVVIYIFPNDFEKLVSKDFVEFYQKWIRWAKKNYKYLQKSRCLYQPPHVGGVDGYAAILEDQGFIFLCNPNPRPVEAKLPLDETVGLTKNQPLLLKELHPEEGKLHFAPEGGVFQIGSEVSIRVPPFEVLVLEILPYRVKEPLLFGALGEIKVKDSTVVIQGLKGEKGADKEIAILVRKPDRVKRVIANGARLSFALDRGLLKAKVHFDGEKFPCQLDEWNFHEEKRIRIPNEEELEKPILTTRFYVPREVKSILESQKPAKTFQSFQFLEENLEFPPASMGFPDPLWADPSRFIITVPCTFCEEVGEVKAWLNEEKVPVRRVVFPVWSGSLRVKKTRIFCFCIDITEKVKFGAENRLRLAIDRLLEGQFLGPYIENIRPQITSRITPLPIDEEIVEGVAFGPQEAFQKTVETSRHNPIILESNVNFKLTEKEIIMELFAKVEDYGNDVSSVSFTLYPLGELILDYDEETQSYRQVMKFPKEQASHLLPKIPMRFVVRDKSGGASAYNQIFHSSLIFNDSLKS